MNTDEALERFRDVTGRAEAVLRADERFVGLAAVGSRVRNEMDGFSDLDLKIVSAATVPELAEQRALAESIGSLVSAFTGEHVGEPNLLICLYETDTVLHVDLKFEPLAAFATRPYDPIVLWERAGALTAVLDRSSATPIVPDRQWIEDRFWTWIHYAALRVGRAELFDLLSFLGFIREQVLGPLALHAEGFPPHGVRKIERYLPAFARRLQATVPTYDVASCYAAILASIELYRELREVAPVKVNARAERLSVQYLEDVAAMQHGLAPGGGR